MLDPVKHCDCAAAKKNGHVAIKANGQSHPGSRRFADIESFHASTPAMKHGAYPRTFSRAEVCTCRMASGTESIQSRAIAQVDRGRPSRKRNGSEMSISPSIGSAQSPPTIFPVSGGLGFRVTLESFST